MHDSSPSPATDLLDCRHVTRAAGLALGPGKLLLGGVALLLLETDLNVILRLPFADQSAPLPLTDPVDLGSSSVAQALGTGAGLLLSPLRSVISPGLEIFRSGSSWPQLATAWTRLLWALLVWSLFGGAIARMAAVQFAGRTRIGVRAALKFSFQQMLSYLSAPLLPLAGIGCLLAFNAVLGALAGMLGSVGETILGLVWGLVLFCGLLMALLLLSISAGWPLMVAAVSTEDSDGFDGLGRANGFLLDRPWRALCLVALSLLVFALSWLLAGTLASLAVYLSAWATAAGDAGQTARWQWLSQTWLPDEPTPRDYWIELPRLLLRGFGPSFFWCGVTVIYFVLRKTDDGTSLDDVTMRVEEAVPPTVSTVEAEAVEGASEPANG